MRRYQFCQAQRPSVELEAEAVGLQDLQGLDVPQPRLRIGGIVVRGRGHREDAVVLHLHDLHPVPSKTATRLSTGWAYKLSPSPIRT